MTGDWCTGGYCIVNHIDTGGGGFTPIDYSTSEQDTGLKWTNGSTIYQRSFVISSYETVANTEKEKDVTGALFRYCNIIDVKGVFGLYYDYNYYTVDLDSYLPNGMGAITGSISSSWYRRSGTVYLKTTTPLTRVQGIRLTVYYTKDGESW